MLFYKRFVSPVLHALIPGLGCKFHPTCSVYMKEAIQTYGVAKGGWLGLKRLGKCGPFCEGGYDPVPHNIKSKEK